MGIFEIFSKRQRKSRGEFPDVYVYDELPAHLRVQIVHIVTDAIGKDNYNCYEASKVYTVIKEILCREYGVFELVKYPKSDAESVINFFLEEESTEKALDVVEVAFKLINGFIRDNRDYGYSTTRKIDPDDAIDELNQRFKEHGVGYQFESNELLRIDSDFIHAEAVKPTLAILRDKSFKGANEEFLLAHEHYRHKRFKESVVNSLKAFESTMKTICLLRKWPTQPSDTAKTLINTCVVNGLFPSYLESQFGSLRSLLESGIPTIRNKNGGHGQGADPVVVPEYLARYVLNLTATSILFLVEANESSGK